MKRCATHAIAVGAVEPGWGIDLGALAGIWRAGCVLRAERDRLGSHTYARTGRLGTFHTLCSGDRGEVEV